jgi:predicted SAM-dependent methyltransferase
VKIILLSGPVRREGWVTLDANPDYQPDICASIPPLPLVVTGHLWDEIEIIHGLNCLYPWDAVELLRQIHAVLAPQGKLVLELPDFNRVKDSGKMQWVFGDPSGKDGSIMCRWAYTSDSLIATLTDTGFSRCEIRPALYHFPGRDFRVEAYR